MRRAWWNFPAQHQYLDDGLSPGNGTSSDLSSITVTVTDDDSGSGSDTTSVTVNNVLPDDVNLSLSSSTINEDDSVTLTGTFTDPGTLDVHTVTVNWGEGCRKFDVLPVGSRTFTFTHQYLDDNPTGTPTDVYEMSVVVADNDEALTLRRVVGRRQRVGDRGRAEQHRGHCAKHRRPLESGVQPGYWRHDDQHLDHDPARHCIRDR